MHKPPTPPPDPHPHSTNSPPGPHPPSQDHTQDYLHDYADAVLALVRRQDTAFIELQQIARTMQVPLSRPLSSPYLCLYLAPI